MQGEFILAHLALQMTLSQKVLVLFLYVMNKKKINRISELDLVPNGY